MCQADASAASWQAQSKLASGQYRGEFTRAAYGGTEVDQALWIWTIAVF
jgi:hypothetical protein